MHRQTSRSRHTGARALALALCLGAVSCAEEETDTPTESQHSQPSADDEALSETGRQLQIGDQGAGVERLHGYLKSFGYLPNRELELANPAWKPAIDAAPADPAIFDETTSRALKALQRRYGLEETGRTDEATRQVLEAPRCEQPDNLPAPSASDDKYFVNGRWNKNVLTWRVVNKPSDVKSGLADARTLISDLFAEAAAMWSGASALRFEKRTSGSVDIEIRFTDLKEAHGLNTAAAAYFPQDGGDILVDVLDTDSSGRSTIPVRFDRGFLGLMVHELGHALGLAHSSVAPCVPGAPGRCTDSTPAMVPVNPAQVLSEDDRAAIRLASGRWLQGGVCARDVAVSTNGVVMRVGCEDEVGGGWLSVFNGSSWSRVNQIATRVALDPSGLPWVVDGFWNLFRGQFAPGGYSFQLMGCATDVGIGGDGSVWIIGCSWLGDGGFDIRRFNPGTGGFDQIDGQATRIAVGKDGKPWVVNAANQIYRRQPWDVWEHLASGAAKDIAVGPFNNAYVIGIDDNLWAWVEQPQLTYGSGSVDRKRCSSSASCDGGTCITGICWEGAEAARAAAQWDLLRWGPFESVAVASSSVWAGVGRGINSVVYSSP